MAEKGLLLVRGRVDKVRIRRLSFFLEFSLNGSMYQFFGAKSESLEKFFATFGKDWIFFYIFEIVN